MLTADQYVYRISSYSGNGANCVEVAVAPQTVGVRDSKDRAGGHFSVAPAQWGAFLDVVKTGALDR